MFTKYGKFVWALLAALAVWGINASTGGFTLVEVMEGLAVAAVPVTVVLVPITPQYPWVKTGAAFVTTLSAVAIGVFNDGFATADLVVLITEAAMFFGVWLAPASSSSGASVALGSDRLASSQLVPRTGPVR